MAVKLEGSIKRWIGISSDTKPFIGTNPDGTTLNASDIPPGSSFLESDTGIVYRWTGTAWVSPQADDRVLELLRQILDEAKRARLIQEFALDLNSNDFLDPMVN